MSQYFVNSILVPIIACREWKEPFVAINGTLSIQYRMPKVPSIFSLTVYGGKKEFKTNSGISFMIKNFFKGRYKIVLFSMIIPLHQSVNSFQNPHRLHLVVYVSILRLHVECEENLT